jgi:hypothetical protein
LKKNEAKQLKHRVRYQQKMQPEASLWLKVEKIQRRGSDITPSQKSVSKIKNTKAQKALLNF